MVKISRNKIGDWIRAQQSVPTAIGGQSSVVEGIADPSPGCSIDDDAIQDEGPLLRRAIEMIRGDFTESTWVCFRRTVLEGCAANVVAEDLNMTSKAVRQAKYRVLHRLRTEFDGLIDLSKVPE